MAEEPSRGVADNTWLSHTGPARSRTLPESRHFHAEIPVALRQCAATPKQWFAAHAGEAGAALVCHRLDGIAPSSRCGGTRSTPAARQLRTASLGSSWRRARVAPT